ncbi:MAG: crossover junction endodeoxyribonuclease RuvC [Armatimonadota bacterium]|nr:crossover junction endodeoxyribonuclease RuvC [Armatimonadota bacterium]MDW8157164.1 crossover junction endodeoxyribonuclease RuvC [Armatimonadota bacterium]
MVAVGLDPGWCHTGYAVVGASPAGLRVREVGVVRSSAPDLPSRLEELYREAMGLLEEVRPQVVVLEDVFSHPRHPRTAVLMAHVRSVLCLAAAHSGAAVQALTPAEVKRAVCGNGRAPKSQVQAAVCRFLGVRGNLDSHAADALALAATALVRSGFPMRALVGVP